MNLKRQHLRSLKRRREHPADLGDHQVPVVEPHDPERAERRRALRAALVELPDNQREVIELHWLEGIPMSEVAEIVGASRSAVKVRAHRGYERLRGLLAPLPGNRPDGDGV